MSPELVQELSQLMFVIPKSQGGGILEEGKTVLCRQVKPRLIYIVYSGAIRECTLMKDPLS